jgi:hypothetical protein
MSSEIVVKWSWEDAKALYPNWTKEECIEAMEEVEGYVHERVVELGNEVLQQLLYEIVETEWLTKFEEEE